MKEIQTILDHILEGAHLGLPLLDRFRFTPDPDGLEQLASFTQGRTSELISASVRIEEDTNDGARLRPLGDNYHNDSIFITTIHEVRLNQDELDEVRAIQKTERDRQKSLTDAAAIRAADSKIAELEAQLAEAQQRRAAMQ